MKGPGKDGTLTHHNDLFVNRFMKGFKLPPALFYFFFGLVARITDGLIGNDGGAIR